MRRFNFAPSVSVVDGVPFATHLPFIVEESEEGDLLLLAHFAKANPQWQSLAEQTVLVIFSEPHAYVSPSLYEKEQNVPTWNYVAVHACGTPGLIPEEKAAFGLLEKQMRFFEPAYLDQWQRLSQEYKNAMIKGIVAFEIPVTKLEAKSKLSQNKSERDRKNVMTHLLEDENGSTQLIGEMMKNQYNNSQSNQQ